jgi:hypothetical protein
MKQAHHGRDFGKPDLFVYNCLGPEVQDLKLNFQVVEEELFNDEGTSIVAKNYNLDLNEDIGFHVNPIILKLVTSGTPNQKKAFY